MNLKQLEYFVRVAEPGSFTKASAIVNIAQPSMAGLKLNVALEASGIQSILELVEAGHGYDVLGQTALAASGRPEQFSLRPLTNPGLTSTLFLARSAHKPSTPLILQAQRLLQDLLLSSTQPSHAESR
jgi:LysR family nitrogen assimilation transcriptional regulator